MNFPLLILCGGRATRMKELTKETPKSLLMIDDKPFLFHQLKKIEEYGRRKVILCTGVFSEQIESFIANEEFDLDILISKETQPLGTGGAVKYASRSLNSPFFVTYGDSFLDYQFKEMEGKYRLSGYPLLAIYRNEELHDVSNVVLKNGKVFYSKEKEKVPDAKYIDYGISLLESKYFDSYPQRFDLAELIENLSYKQILDHYEVKTRFYEIGSFSGYDETIKLLKR